MRVKDFIRSGMCKFLASFQHVQFACSDGEEPEKELGRYKKEHGIDMNYVYAMLEAF